LLKHADNAPLVDKVVIYKNSYLTAFFYHIVLGAVKKIETIVRAIALLN